MPKSEIRTFKNLEELSRGAAGEFVSLARQRHAAGASYSAALSGGSTPKRFYELLATEEFSSQVSWPHIDLFQVDERCVPPDDPLSNYRMIRRAMLEAIPEVRFHRIAAERGDRDAAARDYAESLCNAIGTRAGDWPQLDVIYLGMGGDGHTASLFPGTAVLNERSLSVAPNYVAKLDMWRLTLTLPVLNAASHVVFLVDGAEKSDMVSRVLAGDSTGPLQYPAQLVQPDHGAVVWYLDDAAAQRLEFRAPQFSRRDHRAGSGDAASS